MDDFAMMVPILNGLNVRLAGGDGEGNPIVNYDEIIFNGMRHCGHEERNLGITWPADGAKGVCFAVQKGETSDGKTQMLQTLEGAGWSVGNPAPLATGDSDVGGTWHAGLKLNTRTCGGDCSHEGFYLPRVLSEEDIDFSNECHGSKPPGGYRGDFCKTAYKPYDLAVICCLIIARHHLGKAIHVGSDGDRDKWADGREICQKLLGYGEDFHFSEAPKRKSYWKKLDKSRYEDGTWGWYNGSYISTTISKRRKWYWSSRNFEYVVNLHDSSVPEKTCRTLEAAKACAENEMRKARELRQCRYSQDNHDL